MNHPLFPAAGVRRPLRPASQLLPLEQRFMFDGAVADAAHAAQHDTAPPPVPPAVTVRAIDPARDDGKKEVALVDTSVANYKSLEAGVRDGVGIVEFDGSRDGLAQIARWAAGQSGLDAIHILSHGSEGTLNLGTARLTDAALSSPTVQAELARLGQALSADGDLLLYGCDVAAGDHNALIADLARVTGADVAASRDATGAAAIGGNWTLEAHAGKIDTKALDIGDYRGLLTTITFTGSDADYSSTTVVKQVNGQNVTFSGGASAGGLGIDGTYGTDGLYAYQGPTNEVRLTVTIASGYTFDVSSFDVGVLTGSLTIDLTYGDNTTDTLTVNSLANGWQTVLNSGLSKPINDVKQVVFSSGDFGLFQNFDITDVKAILHPPTVTVNSASLSADTGTSSSDFITKTAAQTISGTLSTTLSTGEKVEVSYDNGGSWSDATTYTVGSSSWSTTTTLAGGSTFQARVTNADGSSTAYTHSYTLDTTAPTTSFSGIALSADTGTSSTDLVTKTASQTITATLSGAPAGTDIVWGSVDGGGSWTDVTSKVAGTTLTWNGATLGAGSSSIAFKVTDAAGNDSGVSSQNYTLDTTAPTTTVSSASFSNDSGTSSSDFITQTAAQDLSGTLSANLAAGESVLVSLDNGATWATATASTGQSTWSLTGRTLTASNTLKVKVSDTAGNDGSVLSQAYVYDTTAPTITFNSLALSADTGASASDFITRTAAQTITATLSATLAAGDIVYGSLDNGGSWTDITGKVSGTALSWNGVTLAGSDTLQLKVVDAAGNSGSAKTQAYTLDTSTPATPGTPELATASDTGASSSDGVTSDTTPTLSGTAENGSTVTVFDGATLLGTVTAGAGGWTLTTGALAEGSHSITAVSTDTAGNATAASAALTLQVDTTAPAVTSVAVPADGTYYNGDPLDFTVNFDEAVIVDTSGGTPRIALVVGATTRYASYVSGSGTSALVFRYTVPSGDVDADGVTVGALSPNGGTLRDTAGNDATTTLNSVASTAGVDVDGTSPSVTGISATTADGSYAEGQTITITVDFSTAVDVDTSGGTPTLTLDNGGVASYAGGSGSGTLTFTYLVGAGQNSADLDYSSTTALAFNAATITDAGGSHRAADLTLAAPGTAGSLGANKDIVIDTTAPTNTVAGASLSADTGSSSTDFITQTAAQTISGTLTSNLAAGEHVYVSLDDGATWTQATDSTGANTWSLSGQTLSGSGTLKVRVSDDAGNNGAAYAQAYVLDTTAPTTSFSGVALSADTGASATDLITNTAAQTITATLSGAPAAGDIVYGSLDNGATWTDITGKVSGATLTWNGVTLAASDTLKLRVTDAAGNDGAATSQAYVLDTTAPTTSVASAAFSADSGVSSTDFITHTAAQTVSGTLSANLVAGESVLVSLDNGASWSAASATVGSNAWSLAGCTLRASDTLQVKVADTAGNDGPVLAQAYVYDTAASTPTVDTLTTTSLTPVLTGGATLAAGETMTVAVGGATYNVVPAAGRWSLDLSTAVPSGGALALVMNNQYSVVATVTDLAGNTASDGSNNELTVGTITPPVTPPTTTVTDAALSADSGASHSDFITNVAAQNLSGSLSAALRAGESVLVSVDGGNSWRTASASGASWSLDGVTLAGNGQLQVKVSSADGDGAVYSQAYVLDTTAPVVPTVDAQTAPTTAPTLTGSATLASGELLTVDVGGATYQVAVNGGSWSLDLARATPSSGTLVLTAGQRYDVSAVVTDLAGNASHDTSSGELLVSGVPTTLVTGAALSADSGASASDFITNVAAQTISGTLSAALGTGEKVQVSYDNGGSWSDATSYAVGSSGWSTSTTLAGGGTFQARVTDAGGSSAAYTHSYTLDTTAPTTSFTGIALSADTGASSTDLITKTAAQTITATLSGAPAGTDIVWGSVDGGGHWTDVTSKVAGTTLTWNGATLGAGANAIAFKVTDAAGNDSGVSSQNYTLDTTAPVVPTVDAQTAPTTTPTLTGSATLASGELLTVSVGGATYQVAVSGGSWSLDLARATPSSGTLALTAGQRYDVSAVVTDLAGNASHDTSSGELLVSGVPTTLVTGAALSADSGASASDFITNVAAQTISGALSAPLAAGERVEVSLDGGATWSNAAAATGAASWSIAVTLGGSNVFMARVSNDAGHGAPSQHAYALDTSAPLASPTGGTLSPAGVLTGGLSAPLAAGESVVVSRDNGASWQPASVSGDSWSSAGGADGTVLVAVRDTAGNTGSVLTVAAVVAPPVVPPVQQVPVVTEPPPPPDTRPTVTGPSDVTAATPATGDTPAVGGTPLTGTIPAGGAIGVAPGGQPAARGFGGPAGPNTPASPLTPTGLATLTEPATLLTSFTPGGLPNPPFAGDTLAVNTPIPDVTVSSGRAISLQVASDSFASTSGDSPFSLSALSADGKPLPAWLKFDPGAARFEGTPPPGFEGTLNLKITARDSHGRVAVQTFKIVVSKEGQAVKSSSIEALPAGRSGLNEQMRMARGAGAERLAVLSRSAAAAKAAA